MPHKSEKFMRKQTESMKKCIRILLFSLIFSFSLVAEDFYKPVYDFAFLLESKGEIDEAMTEYKRYVFLQRYAEGDFLSQSFAGLCRCSFKKNDLDGAIYYIRRAEENEKGGGKFSSYERQEVRLLMLKSLQFEDWLAFENNFSYTNETYPDFFSDEERKVILNGIKKYYDFSPKSLRLASCLSVIPGLGQIYAHDFADGANAFLLDSPLLVVSAYSLMTFHFFDFILLEASPTFRFYLGNFQNARKDTEKYNAEKISEIKLPIVEILSKKD